MYKRDSRSACVRFEPWKRDKDGDDGDDDDSDDDGGDDDKDDDAASR